MITDTINTTALFTSLDETWAELLKLISSANEKALTTIPCKYSWTAAQLIVHVKKSNKGIKQALNMEGKTADRNHDERVPELKKVFLDFDAKYQSPEFIVPEKGYYNKEEIIEGLKKSIEQLQDMRMEKDLSEIISLPIFGEVTKLELLHFVLYHTQRHIHQLKKILKAIKEK